MRFNIFIIFCVSRFRIIFLTAVGAEIVDACFHKYNRPKPAADARFRAHIASATRAHAR